MSITLQYLGQCGFLMITNNLRIAFDPVLTPLLDDGVDIRNYPPLMEPEELNADYIFCTHDHIDHMAIDTLMGALRSCEKTKIVVPRGCVRLLMEAGISCNRVEGLAADESIMFKEDGVRLTGLSAAHPIHQLDEYGLDRNLIYSVVVEQKQFVHLGDTYLTNQIKEQLKDLGKIDVLFLPINGRDAEREQRGIIGNLNCEEAAYLATYVKAGLSIPMHFDMVKGNTEDPCSFVRAIEKQEQKYRYWVPTIEKTELKLEEEYAI